VRAYPEASAALGRQQEDVVSEKAPRAVPSRRIVVRGHRCEGMIVPNGAGYVIVEV